MHDFLNNPTSLFLFLGIKFFIAPNIKLKLLSRSLISSFLCMTGKLEKFIFSNFVSVNSKR